MNDHPSPAPWHARARKTFVIARGLTLAAIGAYFGGVMIYFVNFSFGSGGNTFGAALMFVSLPLGVAALLADLFAIAAAWLNWRHSGGVLWLALALLAPLLEIAAFALLFATM